MENEEIEKILLKKIEAIQKIMAEVEFKEREKKVLEKIIADTQLSIDALIFC